MQLLQEKDRMLISEMFSIRGLLSHAQTGDMRALHGTGRTSQHMWMLKGRGQRSTGVKDNTTPEMTAKT